MRKKKGVQRTIATVLAVAAVIQMISMAFAKPKKKQ